MTPIQLFSIFLLYFFSISPPTFVNELFNNQEQEIDYSNYLDKWISAFDERQDLSDLIKLRKKFDKNWLKLNKIYPKIDSTYISKAYIYAYYWRSFMSKFSENEQKVGFVDHYNVYLSEQTTYVNQLLSVYPKIPPDKIPIDLLFVFQSCIEKSKLIQFYREIRSKPAPDFSFSNIDSKKYSLNDFRGKFVLIHFWNSNYIDCMREFPILVELYDSFEKKGFTIISINADYQNDEWDGNRLIKLIDEKGLAWYHCIDGGNRKIHNLYKVRSWPTCFLLNGEGYAIKYGMGLKADWLKQTLREVIK